MEVSVSRTTLHLVNLTLLERGVSIYNSHLLVKDIKELSDKIGDRLNSFGIYTSFIDDEYIEGFDKSLDTDRSVFEVDSRYHNNCSLVIQVLDKTVLP